MALFKKKPPAGEGEPSAEEAGFEPQPEKARKWFDHAKTSADSYNFEYALTCFATGIKLDPGIMAAHKAMLESGVKYANGGGKPAASREVKSIADGTAVGKFAAAEFEFMKDLTNFKAAVRMLDAAVKAEQVEFGSWIAPRVLSILRQQKKLTKSSLVQAMDLFRACGAWDESMVVGEMARQLDPSDGDLAARLKNLSAQRAMDQGGYEEAMHSEGGFRKFIKDADKQQELIESETLAGGGSIDERNLMRAQQEYEKTPAIPEVLNRYAQLLKKQGTDEAIEQARQIYEKGFDDTGEYRFRMSEGDVRIERLERALREIDEHLEESPEDADAKSMRDTTNTELLALRDAEYAERVERYPTDRVRRYELGLARFDLGHFEDAMAEFQKAKDEPKLKVRAGHMLGRCFFEAGWYSDAAAELEDALGAIDATEKDRELSVRYDLMLALLEAAREENSLEIARKAKTICSEIARKDITYRDIRTKRREVDELIKSISGEA